MLLHKSTFFAGIESHDNERRRQIALKALSERLNKSDSKKGATSPTQEWPSLEGDDVPPGPKSPAAGPASAPHTSRPAPVAAHAAPSAASQNAPDSVVVVGEGSPAQESKGPEQQPLL